MPKPRSSTPPLARRPSPAPEAPPDALASSFTGLLGLVLGLGLLKWGNPVILDRLVEQPRTFDEWRLFAWPLRLGYLALAPVALLGLGVALRAGNRRPACPAWIPGLLVGWFAWQFLAAVGSADRESTAMVLPHFAACTLCFALGHFALGRIPQTRVFWLCLTLAFFALLGFAFEQHFGGLEATRKMILESPNSAQLPQEYLARIQSNRVFATLVYPNALAGAILLILPLAVVVSYHFARTHGVGPARLVAGSVILGGVLVLAWSGSKAGWLIAMGLVLLILVRSPISQRLRLALVGLFVVAGLAGFAWRYSEKLSRGATSLSARTDYWAAAWQGLQERPVLGQGPGAFKRLYARVKRPESEMAQLAHNDYLQQAADSGLPGGLAYAGFIWGGLAWLFRHRFRHLDSDPLSPAVGIGLLGWFTQGFIEFGLYLPATAWIAFTLFGWLLAQKPSPLQSTTTTFPPCASSS